MLFGGMDVDGNGREFLKQINGEVLIYFPHALARCLATFSNRYKRCPIEIALDMNISLYRK